MDLHLSGRTAIVTGASRGIGLAITEALAEEGVTLVAAARQAGPDLTRLAQHRPVKPVPADLATPDGPARLVTEAVGHVRRRVTIRKKLSGHQMTHVM